MRELIFSISEELLNFKKWMSGAQKKIQKILGSCVGKEKLILNKINNYITFNNGNS